MRLSMQQLMGGTDVLAGVAEGRLMLSRGVAQIREPDIAEALYLDFDGVQVATGSFLREGPLELRDLVRRRRSRLYPVFANVGDRILDDIGLLMEMRNDAVLSCRLSRRGTVSDVRLIGALDEKQALTFELVRRLGNVGASTLAAAASREDIGQNAWSNRLAALVEKGLIMESTRGRAKSFRLATSE